MQWTDDEFMVSAAARQLTSGDSVLVGVGIPNLACNLAKQTHAPELCMIYESGVIDADPDSLPLSIGDPVLFSGARSAVSMYDGFTYYLQAGRVDVGFLGGAQIDRWGNINSTVIGDYDEPTVRLPGSGGACEIASHARRTIIITKHQRRKFPEELDFTTSPGYVNGREGREALGLRGGPDVVITDKAIMEFDEDGEMFVSSIHPGVTESDIRDATAWEIPFAEHLEETRAPSEREITLIRTELDPDGVYVDKPATE